MKKVHSLIMKLCKGMKLVEKVDDIIIEILNKLFGNLMLKNF